MNYIEADNKELQEVWEQLVRAVQDLESSDSLTQFERDEKARIIRQLNRRYEVLNNRAQYNRISEIKITQESQAVKFLRGFIIGVCLGLIGYVVTVLRQ